MSSEYAQFLASLSVSLILVSLVVVAFCLLAVPLRRDPSAKLIDQSRNSLHQAVANCGGPGDDITITDDHAYALATAHRSDRTFKAPIIFAVVAFGTLAFIWSTLTFKAASPYYPAFIVGITGGLAIACALSFAAHDYCYPKLQAITICGRVIYDLSQAKTQPYRRKPSFLLHRDTDAQVSAVTQKTAALVSRAALKTAFPELLFCKVATSLAMTKELERSFISYRSEPTNLPLRRAYLIATLRILDLNAGVAALRLRTTVSAEEEIAVNRIIYREAKLRRMVFAGVYVVIIAAPPAVAGIILHFVPDLHLLRSLFGGLLPLLSVGAALYGIWRKFVLRKQTPFADIQQSITLSAPPTSRSE